MHFYELTTLPVLCRVSTLSNVQSLIGIGVMTVVRFRLPDVVPRRAGRGRDAANHALSGRVYTSIRTVAGAPRTAQRTGGCRMNIALVAVAFYQFDERHFGRRTALLAAAAFCATIRKKSYTTAFAEFIRNHFVTAASTSEHVTGL